MNKTINLIDEENQQLALYRLEQYEDLFMDTPEKPSARIYQTKRGKKAIAGLQMIEKDYDISWYQAVKNRWLKRMDKEFLFYRANSITAEQAFAYADKLAEAFAYIGIQKGDEIPCCLSNIPEMVYVLLAANKLGAKVNLFAAHYDPAYIDIILNDASNKLFIASDDVYGEIKDAVAKHDYLYKLVVSLADSLPEDPTKCDEYEPKCDRFYHYENKAKAFAAEDVNLMTWGQFLELGNYFKGTIVDDNNLNTEFLITYTSGSTKIGFPKRMIHCNRSPIVIGVFHDPALCGNPAVIGLRTMAHIHTDSNTNIITSISDAFFQNWSVGLEPEYAPETFLDLLMVDKPNVVTATSTFFAVAAKQYLMEGQWNDRKFDFLLSPLCVGEGCCLGQERFINAWLKKSKAGSGVNLAGPIHFPYITIGIGGGDTEHGGIYYTLWKGLYQGLNKFKLKGEQYGMEPVPYVQVAVLKQNDNGEYEECDYGEEGVIVANSYTNMKKYKEFHKVIDKVITDNKGRDWLSCDVFGYIDKMGNVHMKDRKDALVTMENGKKIYPFRLADIAQEDIDNVFFALVTTAEVDGKTMFVMNYEISPLAKKDELTVLNDMAKRINKAYPDLSDRIVYRLYNDEYLFPITGSGKRNIVEVAKSGAAHTFKLVNGKKVKL